LAGAPIPFAAARLQQNLTRAQASAPLFPLLIAPRLPSPFPNAQRPNTRTHTHTHTHTQLELREYDAPEKPSSGPGAAAAPESDTAEEKKDAGGPVRSSPAGTSASSSCGSGGSGAGAGGVGVGDDGESEMRGVHTSRALPPSTCCVAVPRRCLITVEMGQATPIGTAILMSDLDLDAPKHIFLMVYLLWDRRVNGARSFFAPYYDILPRTLSNMPIFWSEEELEELRGSHLLAQIADRNEAIADDYHSICEVAPGLADIATLEEFKWARMCVCSRNFGLQIDGHRTSALVPYADMLNHYRPRETKWTFDDDLQAFTITTLQAIPAGAQVYDSYGQKCNHRFLLNYGFAVEDNRELDGFCPNEVPLGLGLDPADPLYEERAEFWTRGEGGGGGASAGGGATAVAAAATVLSAAASGGTGGVAALASALAVASGAHPPAAKQVESAVRAAEAMSAGGSAGRPVGAAAEIADRASHSVATGKRVRVCISNNDNTRALFSLLRVMACNEVELRAIAAVSPQARGAGADEGCQSYLNRTLFGLTAEGGASATAAASQGTYRTARDIRHPINVCNERAAMELLLGIISKALKAYPTLLAQDFLDLVDEEAYPRFSNVRHAKIQARGEKEVLHHFAQWAKAALDILDVIDKELKLEWGEISDEEANAIVQEPGFGFDYAIRAMEEQESSGVDTALHHTIVRYCADVLGSLRREEIKIIRRIKLAASARANSGGAVSEFSGGNLTYLG